MELEALQKNWNKAGKEDPYYAILSDPQKMGNKWGIDDFFNTGVKEIDTIMKYIESLGIEIQQRNVLDFGCGIGRLTQPLNNYFDEVYGIDIAPSMIELANKYNCHIDKCKYFLNESDDLKLFNDNYFDFIYTNIVLQHIEPKYTKKYLLEFIRILAPGGILIFQLPSDKVHIQRIAVIKELIKNILPSILLNLYRKLKKGKGTIIEMYGIKKEEIVTFLEEHGVMIIDISQDYSAGKDWLSFRYCVMKNVHAT